MGAMAALARSLRRYVPPTVPDDPALRLRRCAYCGSYHIDQVSGGSPDNIFGKFDDNDKYWYCWQCWEWWQEEWWQIYKKWGLSLAFYLKWPPATV